MQMRYIFLSNLFTLKPECCVFTEIGILNWKQKEHYDNDSKLKYVNKYESFKRC